MAEETTSVSGRKIESLTIEFHSKNAGGFFPKGAPYVAAAGRFMPARDFSMPLSQEECLIHLAQLRYQGTESQAREARRELGEHLRQIVQLDSLLRDAFPNRDVPIQLDLVSNAEELWALPFEACLAEDDEPAFVGRQPPVILTRRIRHGFPDHQPSWPSKPRVLFITVSPGIDLTERVIEDNREALLEALTPWIQPLEGLEDERSKTEEKKAEKKVLEILVDPWLDDIEAACRVAREAGKPFTHIHILAHGKEILHPILGHQSSWWGLDLRRPEDVGPEQLTRAIAPSKGLPAVVTITACDSANAGNPLSPGKSLAQELHRGGVPVVIASQLPLRKRSALVLTESFYPPLLRGADVRSALNEARTALYRNPECGHDWVSMVAYVELPVGYADALLRTSLKAELGMLETASRWASALERQPLPRAELVRRTERALRDRIRSLERHGRHKQDLDLTSEEEEEIYGLLASAHKRLAQFLYSRGKLAESLEMLKASKDYYYEAYSTNFSRHWTGVQWLSLEAILSGTLEDPFYWRLFKEKTRKAVDAKTSEFWACGTLAELCLLAPIADMEKCLGEAREALELMKKRVSVTDRFPLESTRRQLLRYTNWWTKSNGFFEGRNNDLREDAKVLLRSLI